MTTEGKKQMLKRLLLSLPLMGSLSVLSVLGATELIHAGRSPEFSLVVVMALVLSWAALLAGWITWGLRKD